MFLFSAKFSNIENPNLKIQRVSYQMKSLLGILGMLSVVFLIRCVPKKEVVQSPNIIFIIGDDISWEDIGAYGHPTIRTPNIDRLAREGLIFNNMYVTASSCSPSRTSILTGRYPHNTGAAELHTQLPEHLAYFPELLREKGYFTALAGKWHEGEHTRRAYDTLLVDKKLNGEGGEEQWVNLLKERSKGKPFFFWLAPYDAHREWSDNSQFEKPYKNSEVVVPAHLVDDAETRKDLAAYYNEITRLDHYIGILREELEKEGIAENTIFIFTSDNARAFPGNKTRLFDRGLKTPFIMWWPNGIQKHGNQVDAMISTIDIAPTLLKLAKVDIVSSIQGVSFDQLLIQTENSFRQFIFGEHNWHDYEAYERSVRTKDYLYISNKRPWLTNEGPIDANQSPSAYSLKKGRADSTLTDIQKEVFLSPRPTEELYSIAEDSLQIRNLIADSTYTQIIDNLRSVLAEWQLATGDSVPDSITTDWYHREDGSPLLLKGIRAEMPGASKNAARNNNKGPF